MKISSYKLTQAKSISNNIQPCTAELELPTSEEIDEQGTQLILICSVIKRLVPAIFV